AGAGDRRGRRGGGGARARHRRPGPPPPGHLLRDDGARPGAHGVMPAPAVAAAPALGLGIGALAIRRQGIYFAMTTLALAQMVYFLCLQAPFTHGEDGIQSVPRGVMVGLIDLRQPA